MLLKDATPLLEHDRNSLFSNGSNAQSIILEDQKRITEIITVFYVTVHSSNNKQSCCINISKIVLSYLKSTIFLS